MNDDWFEKEQLHFAAQEGDLEKVKALVGEGISINEFDADLGWTPLHYAVNGEHFDVAAYLIEQGADVNAHREETIGETPLGQVAQTCSLEIAKLLIDAKANPTIAGGMQLTALARAAKRKTPEGIKVFELLKKTSKKFIR